MKPTNAWFALALIMVCALHWGLWHFRPLWVADLLQYFV